MSATLTMVDVPTIVPIPKVLSHAAVEMDSSLQAMDWAAMVRGSIDTTWCWEKGNERGWGGVWRGRVWKEKGRG